MPKLVCGLEHVLCFILFRMMMPNDQYSSGGLKPPLFRWPRCPAGSIHNTTEAHVFSWVLRVSKYICAPHRLCALVTLIMHHGWEKSLFLTGKSSINGPCKNQFCYDKLPGGVHHFAYFRCIGHEPCCRCQKNVVIKSHRLPPFLPPETLIGQQSILVECTPRRKPYWAATDAVGMHFCSDLSGASGGCRSII